MKLNLFATSPSKQIPSKYKLTEISDSRQNVFGTQYTEGLQNTSEPVNFDQNSTNSDKNSQQKLVSVFRSSPKSQGNIQLILDQLKSTSDPRSLVHQSSVGKLQPLDGKQKGQQTQEHNQTDQSPLYKFIVNQDSNKSLSKATQFKDNLQKKHDVSLDFYQADENSSSKSKQSTRNTDQIPQKVLKLSDRIRTYNPLKNFYLQQQQLFYANLQQQIKFKQQNRNSANGGFIIRQKPPELKKNQFIPLALETSVSAPQASTTDINDKNKAKLKKSQGPKLIALMSFTMYPIVRKVCKQDFGMKLWEEDNTDEFDLMWADHAIPLERIAKFKAFQRHSQLPGIGCLTRKDNLGHNLNAMRAKYPDDYDFFPPTFLFPKDKKRLRQEWDGNTVMIVKPEASCQGKGIYLTREIDEITEEHCVVQYYIDKPFLMEKMKFDLRLYVLVTGIDPLRVYLSKEGLARLSTKFYDEVDDQNLDDMMMHLTNYSINKNSTKFQPNRAAIVDSVGHKRSLKFTLKYLEKTEKQDSAKLMEEIKDIVVKTMISGQPHLDSVFKSVQIDDFENSMCFQILGFDIMLDHKCKPYLLEVNHSPSFSTDSPLDEKVKGDLIRDTIRMLGLSKQRKAMYKRNIQAQQELRIKSGKYIRLPAELREKWRLEFDEIRNAYETENLGSYEQIYPCKDENLMLKYETLLKCARKEYQERNAAKYSIRSRKNTVSNNQRLLLTASKSVTKEEKSKGQTDLVLSVQKQKLQMNQNMAYPPLSRPGARKTMPITGGMLQGLIEPERPLVNSKEVSFNEEQQNDGQIIGFSEMVNKLQNQLTLQIMKPQEQQNLLLSTNQLTSSAKANTYISPMKQISKYQTTALKDGQMTPVGSQRQDSIFGQREALLSHQSSKSRLELERLNNIVQNSANTPTQNRIRINAIQDLSGYKPDIVIDSNNNQLKHRVQSQKQRNRDFQVIAQTSSSNLQQQQILENYEFEVGNAGVESMRNEVRNFTNWKAQEAAQKSIQSQAKPPPGSQKQYYPMMIQTTENQGLNKLHRRKSQKSLIGANSMSLIDEENVPCYTDKKVPLINGSIDRQNAQGESEEDVYQNKQYINTGQTHKSGSQSLPTNKLRKSYRKNTTEIQHISRASDVFLPLRQPLKKNSAPQQVTSNLGGEFLRPKILDFQPRGDQIDPLRRNNINKNTMNANYNRTSYRLDNNQRRPDR